MLNKGSTQIMGQGSQWTAAYKL